MDAEKVVSNLKAYAEYLRRTRLPVGEKEAIERVLNCAFCLEKLAKEIETDDEADHQQGE